jgi:hypothetical protein
MDKLVRTLGAVVLTLNATGWALGLDIVSERFTKTVSGPGRKGVSQGKKRKDCSKTHGGNRENC